MKTKKPHQNLSILGHVDHGKSTLVGRLLYENGMIDDHDIEQFGQEAQLHDKAGFEFAYVMDDLAEERERGLTIDIAHQEFTTEHNAFTIIDCPGHQKFTKNMITGASQADNAVLVVAADDGVQRQTREHVFLSRTLDISKFVVAINKMDLVEYSKTVYQEIVNDVKNLFSRVDFAVDKKTFVPVSALKNDNIFSTSDHIPWYEGPTLVQALDNLESDTLATQRPLRVPIDEIHTISGIGTVPAGRVETGAVGVGDRVAIQPSDVSGDVSSIEMHYEGLDTAKAGDNIGIHVRNVEEEDIETGDVVGPTDHPPTVATEFRAQLFVLYHPSTIQPGYTPVLQAHAAQVPCEFLELKEKLGPAGTTVIDGNPFQLESGDSAIVDLAVEQPIAIEEKSNIPELGSFVIRDMSHTIAAGKVLDIRE